jgi:Effector Associated Constant Component 1
MEIRIEVDGEAYGRDSLSLRRWLRGEDGLRGLVKPAVVASQDGQMGSATDVLVVAVGSGGRSAHSPRRWGCGCLS